MEFDSEKIKQIEALLEAKSFQELTLSERALVMEFVESAAEYDSLVRVELLVAKWYGTAKEHLEPSPGTLQFLESKLSSEFPITKASSGPNRSVFNYPVPLSAAVAACIIIGFLFWWIGESQPQVVEKTIFVELPGKVDTLFVDTAPDTFYIEKVIYREVSTSFDVHSFNSVSETDELAKIDLLAFKSGLPISADSVLQSLIVTDN